MRVVLTGSSSFLGRALKEKLEEKGVFVTAYRHSFEEEPCEDRAEAWIHLGWAGKGSEGRSDERLQRENVEMSLRALKEAQRRGCTRFIFAGSQAEYGGIRTDVPDGLQHETDPCRPVSAYGKAKLLFGEKAAELTRGTGMDYIHLRLFSVYGPGDHETALVPYALGCFRKGDPLSLGPCTQTWNYLYIEDAVDAILLILEKGQGGVYNVASEISMPLRQYLEEAKEICRSSSTLCFGTRGNNAEGAADMHPDVSKLCSLGFKERHTFSSGIRRMLEKEREQNREQGYCSGRVKNW